MIKLYTIVIFLLLLIYTENPAQVRTAEAFAALTFDNPVEIADPNDGFRKLFVVTQNGIIYSFDNSSTASQKKVFLDISSKVIAGNELGLLGLAFHPNYKDSGYFYVNYTTNFPEGTPVRSVISRFKVNG
ncbi:MAG TPA: PQQ-dependent sugar dehydrogenase, partial [Ignavibacteriales bacterium]|nr:PQQ-dependent sugar dehydrogenase [Ignavibacteriales bacterium]